jgi:hypothetical protein
MARDFGGSRTSQILAELILQFSSCVFALWREEKRRGKKGNGFPALKVGHCTLYAPYA